MAASWAHLIMAAMFTALLGAVLLGCGSGAADAPDKTEPTTDPSEQKEPPKTKDGVEFYFGCGCFWHMQHEFVTLEQEEFRRMEGDEITSRTAYAGGTKEGANGLVCYTGANNYATLGHTEVVSIHAQEGTFQRLAEKYWELCPGGVRKDLQDAGSQYRSAVGVPGGFTSKYMDILKAALPPGTKANLLDGKGNEGDTGSSGTVYVYDTMNFPAFTAEKDHQFHDDMSEAYGNEYNDYQSSAKATACPRDVQFTTTAAPAADFLGPAANFRSVGPRDTCTGPHESCCGAPGGDVNNCPASARTSDCDAKKSCCCG